jgi:tetratricopeptide (TPR) repeat protein
LPVFPDTDQHQRLLGESNSLKAQANKLFTSARYSEAIGEYDKALASCPSYLEYECAVLRSNIAACHLKLEDWKAAVEAATASLEALDRLQPKKIPTHTAGKADNEPETVVEIEGDGEDAEKELAELQLSDQRKEDIRRIRAKALMRRAKAKMEQNGWGNLAAAEEDYKELSKMSNLPAQDQKIVRTALATLPARINAAKEKEMGEMMGKLKEVRIFVWYVWILAHMICSWETAFSSHSDCQRICLR